jgi:Ni/Co efflux regulator RcnB
VTRGHSATFRGKRSLHGRAYLYHGRHLSPWYASRYRWPHGYRYVRYQVGVVLPVVFWSDESFVIFDYGDYGLVAPDDGYEWVRYGDDALLIDTSTGSVTDVAYGVFVEQDGAPDPTSQDDDSQGQDPQ